MIKHSCGKAGNFDDAENLFAYDEEHGIPNLELIDIIADRNVGKGHLLAIVVSKPLDSCKRCQVRLAQKIENYLTYINSDEIVKVWGSPTPDRITIEVNLEKGCHADTFVNLKRFVSWAEGHGATLIYTGMPTH